MLGRVLPLLLVTGTVAVATSEGPATVAKVQGAVRTILQRSELSDTAKLMRSEVERGSPVPKPGNADALAAWLREIKSADAKRDVTLDHWQHPFVLESAGANGLILLSLGINGKRDACIQKDETTADADDICETIPLPRERF